MMRTARPMKALAESNFSRNAIHTNDVIRKIQGPAFARDNLRGAFAGKENMNKKNDLHSTHVKSRKTLQSREKTPKI